MDEYTVGWVCALFTEMAAAKAMLDEVYTDLPDKDPADDNSYCLGKMAGHKVVIASLPAGNYGTTPAATVATHMLRSFKSIRFGLMVGVGGGVPSAEYDIRLGDIVVSQPTGRNGGVIQYDRGKAHENYFERTGVLNPPPKVLLTALTQLRANHEMEESDIPNHLSKMIERRPKMRAKYSHQGTENDVLYQEDYQHIDQAADCRRCDKSCELQREARDDTNPVIHYGAIASGNSVIKSGAKRRRISKEDNVLCFEMEAAGLMQDFPCLVIRGICDYADSHKNKSWQEYAAAAAAAFAKELLSVIPPEHVLIEKPIPQLVSDPILCEKVSETNAILSGDIQQRTIQKQSEEYIKCLQAFKTSNFEMFKNINPARVPGTCNWVLKHPKYQDWLQSQNDDLLWISADPGCGKSVLSRHLIDHELNHARHSMCYFFFKDNEDQNGLAVALCALLHQLFSSQPDLIKFAMDEFRKNGRNLVNDVGALWRILRDSATSKSASGVICILDALDECKREDCQRLIQYLTTFYSGRETPSQRSFHLKFIVTSRGYQNIEYGFKDIPSGIPSIRLAGEECNADISTEIDLVVKQRVVEVARDLELSEETKSILEEKILQTQNRTYLWLHLVLEGLGQRGSKRTQKALLDQINSIPTTLEKIYEQILSRTKELHKEDETRLLLRIIVGARRPLTLSELDIAFHLGGEPDAKYHRDLDLDGPKNLKIRIRQLCGLFIFVNDSRIYLIHQTAKEFLVRQNGKDHQPDGDWRHSLDENQTEITLTNICVRYLSFNDIDDGMYINLKRREFLDRYRFLEYSALHWPDHFQSANTTDGKLLDLICQFYDEESPQSRNWYYIYWRRGYDRPESGLSAAAALGHANIIFRIIDAAENIELNRPLYWASRYGQNKIVQFLIKKGATVTSKALEEAAHRGHEKIVQLLIDKGVTITPKALEYATFKGNEKIIQLLIDNGAIITSKTLEEAVFIGYRKTVQLLINKGTPVSSQALEKAVSNGYEKIVQLLIDKDVTITSKALEQAVSRGHEKIVQLLINKGVTITSKALEEAAFGGNEKIVQLLINKSAPVTSGALERAALKDDEKIVQLLIDKGAPITSKALEEAAFGGNEKTVQLLINKGAPITSIALERAAFKDNEKAVQLLIDKSASATSTALERAAFRGNEKTIRLLIDKGAPITSEALENAALGNRKKILQLLINKGAGITPNALIAVASWGPPEIVQILINHGVDVNIPDESGRTALGEARSRGREEIVKLLVDNGALENSECSSVSSGEEDSDDQEF